MSTRSGVTGSTAWMNAHAVLRRARLQVGICGIFGVSMLALNE
jgi:hypothetical protein